MKAEGSPTAIFPDESTLDHYVCNLAWQVAFCLLLENDSILTTHILCFSGTMEAEDCPFSRLPLHFRDTFLLQAFQQLDQQQQLQVLPLVCKDFHQLAPKATNSVCIVIRSNEAASRLAAWMLQHRPASLHIVTITFAEPKCSTSSSSSNEDAAPGIHPDTRGADKVLCAATQLPALRELCIFGWEAGEHLPLEITSSSVPGQLRGLAVVDCIIMPSMASMIMQLTGLAELVLAGSEVKYGGHDCSDEGFIPTVATSLCHLRRLALCGRPVVPVSEYNSLTALTGLQELVLDPAIPVKAAELDQVLRLPICHLPVAITAHSDLSYLDRWLDASGSGLHVLIVEADEVMEAAVTQQLFMSVKKSAPMLQKLVLSRFELVDAELVASLSNLRQLEVFCGNESSFDSAAVSALSVLTGLNFLQLDGNHWGSTEGQGFGLAGLSCLPKLQEMAVGGPMGVLEECRQAWAGRVLEETPEASGPRLRFKLRPL